MTDQTNALAIQQTEGIQLGSMTVKSPHDVVYNATVVAQELAKIVKKQNLSKVIQGREYVYVDGWTTMGAMLGVMAREITSETHEMENGDWIASVELCRVSDGAVISRGSAIVAMDEKDRNGNLTWGARPKYARRSMAVTRATGKAYRISFSWIMSLAGYATTPAEEMEGVLDGEFVEKGGHGNSQNNGDQELAKAFPISDSQKRMINSQKARLGLTDAQFLSRYKINSIEDLTVKGASIIINELMKLAKLEQAPEVTGEIVDEKLTPERKAENAAIFNQPEAKPERPYAPETVKKKIADKVTKNGNVTANEKQIGLLASQLETCFAGDADSEKKRKTVTQYLIGKESTKNMTGAEIVALLDWVKPEKDSGGAYTPNPMSIKEAALILRQAYIDAGQQELPI